MKKIITTVAAVAMAASMFAVDFSATVQMSTSAAKGTIDVAKDKDGKLNGPTFNFLNLDSKEQKDADAMEVHFAGDKAGANFKFWYKYTGADAALNMRAVNVWFQPVDMLKITIGDIDEGMYKEQMFWWHVASGVPMSTFKAPGWSSNTDRPWCATTTASGSGLSVSLNPIDGLALNVAVAPGSDASFATIVNNEKDATKSEFGKYGMWGASAKYNLGGLSFGVAYRDDGYKSSKCVTVGGDYSVGSFYGMLQARMLFDNTTLTVYDKVYNWDLALTGVSIDNYFKYGFGFMTLEAHLPVTIRGLFTPMIGDKSAYDVLKTTAADADPSYMAWQLKATIPVDAVALYVMIGDEITGNGNDAPVVFNKTCGKNFALQTKVGAAFNVGVCSLDAAVVVDCQNGGDDKAAFDAIAWSIPVTAKVAF